VRALRTGLRVFLHRGLAALDLLETVAGARDDLGGHGTLAGTHPSHERAALGDDLVFDVRIGRGAIADDELAPFVLPAVVGISGAGARCRNTGSEREQ
jgi:hypothetical protein